MNNQGGKGKQNNQGNLTSDQGSEAGRKGGQASNEGGYKNGQEEGSMDKEDTSTTM